MHCLVPENDSIAIVIENDCESFSFQCGCAQEWLAHAHDVKCDLYQNSSATVRRHVTMTIFCPWCCRATSFAATALMFDALVTGKLWSDVQTMVDRHARNIQNRSLTRERRPVRTSPANVHSNSFLSQFGAVYQGEKTIDLHQHTQLP